VIESDSEPVGAANGLATKDVSELEPLRHVSDQRFDLDSHAARALKVR